MTNPPETYRIRPATGLDAALIANQRRRMFTDSADYPPAELDTMEAAYTDWVAAKLAAGEYLGWFAETADGVVVAGVGLWLREWPPILLDPTRRQGYVENVYTAPEHRRQGLARQLMRVLLDWVQTSGCVYSIELHASETAYPLYHSLDFQPEAHVLFRWFGPRANND